MKIKRICVYCGSSVGSRPVYVEAARDLGVALVQRGIELVYGGGRVGLMGASMHERKALMVELSDAFIALPGGFGTIEEFCEVLTWAQLGLHRKPHGLLNVAGYYDSLLAFFDHAVAEKFVPALHRSAVLAESEPEKLLDRLSATRVPELHKWAGRKPG